MRTVAINDIAYLLPSEWNELNKKQLLFLIGLSTYESNEVALKLKMLLFCLGATVTQKSGIQYISAGKQRFEITGEELLPLCELFDFLFETDAHGHKVIVPKLTRNLFPTIARRLIGPSDGLTSLTYNQFIYSQTWFAQLGKMDDAADRLIATLYTRKGGQEDLKAASRLKTDQKVAILWFYIGCLGFLSTKFERVFSGGGDSGGSVYENQMKILHGLSQGDLTKKEVVRASKLHDALYTMEFSAEQYYRTKGM